MRPRRVVIAGAGIGGLTAALALARQGHDVRVLERAPQLDAVGAGVQLSPNASRILIDLGLRDSLAPRATAPTSIHLGSVSAGRTLARLPITQNTDAPYWVIHRADLQGALRDAVRHRAVDLRLGTEVAGVHENAGQLEIVARGETIGADVLIAADGVRSVIRQALVPAAIPISSRWTAWRGMAQAHHFAAVEVWMAPRAHLVAYPVAGGSLTNLVLTLPQSARAEDIPAILGRDRWPEAPRALIAAAGVLTPYPLATVPALAAWSRGSIALLGDAAHAMLPFAAQGAAMAIEDAAVVARCLAEDDDTPLALKRYAALRNVRVAKVAAAARQSGHIYHMRAPLTLARDLAIRALGGKRLMRRQDWIYDWRG